MRPFIAYFVKLECEISSLILLPQLKIGLAKPGSPSKPVDRGFPLRMLQPLIAQPMFGIVGNSEAMKIGIDKKLLTVFKHQRNYELHLDD